jgi:hypothetical protein
LSRRTYGWRDSLSLQNLAVQRHHPSTKQVDVCASIHELLEIGPTVRSSLLAVLLSLWLVVRGLIQVPVAAWSRQCPVCGVASRTPTKLRRAGRLAAFGLDWAKKTGFSRKG